MREKWFSHSLQLAGLAQLVNGGNTMGGKTFNLVNDIWLNADGSLINIWTPIGGKANATSDYDAPVYFSGKFFGNGHKIHNMFVYKPNYYQAGLIGALRTNTQSFDGTIHSVVLVNPVVIAKGAAGSLLGVIGPRGVAWHGTRCHFNTVINAYVYCSENNAGGVIGNTSGGEQLYCMGNVCTGTVIGNNAGGIVGHGQNAEVPNSYFFGTVADVDGGTNYGGISGTTANATCELYSNSNTGSGVNGTYKATIANMQTILANLNVACQHSADFNSSNGYVGWVADACGLNSGLPIPTNVACNVTCQAPLKGTVINIGPYSADITWIGDAGTDAFEIEYGPAATFVPTGSAQYIETGNSVSLSGLNPSTPYTVAVRKDCGGGNYSNWITYYFTTAILCVQPAALTASNNTNSTIDLTWTGPVNGTSYNIEWGPNDNSWTPGASNAPGSGVSYTADYQITGLTDATAYKIAVQANCGIEGTSQWTTIVSGTTADETYGEEIWHGYVYNSPEARVFGSNYLGYIEENPTFDFNSNSGVWGSATRPSATVWVGSAPSDNIAVRYKMKTVLPCGAWTFTIGNDDHVRISADGGATWLPFTNSGAQNAEGWSTANGDFTTSTPINADGNTEYFLVFEFTEGGGGAIARFTPNTALVPVTVDNTTLTPYSFDLTFGGTELVNYFISDAAETNPDSPEGDVVDQGSGVDPADGVITVVNLQPSTTYHIYAQTACGGAWNHVTVLTPNACAVPANVAFNQNTNTLTWLGYGMSGWNIKVSTTAIDPATATAGVLNDGTSSSPEFMAPCLQDGQSYYFYVQADCGSAWASYILSSNLNYCAISASSTDGGNGIQNVTFGTNLIVNNSVSDNSHGSINMIGDAVQGATMPMSITFNTAYSNYNYKVWIDWNNDGDFDDANEIAVNNSPGITSSTTQTLSMPISVPVDAQIGRHRMRIGARWSTSVTACNTQSYLYWHDYTVLVVPGGACTPPPAITASNLTDQSVTLSWAALSPAPEGGYEIYYSTDCTPPDESTSPSEYSMTNTVDISGLSSLTTYFAWIRSNCGDDNSMWFSQMSFTTLPTCVAPTGFSVANVTHESATVNWTGPGNANDYIIEYGPTATFVLNSGENATSSFEASINLSNLDMLTNYTIAVKTSCGTNEESQWATSTFWTLPVETFGDGIWHGYVYAQTENTMKTFGTYLGYVEEQPQFNRQGGNGAWTGENPVWSATAPSDYFSVRYKMTKNFSCGDYVFTINADDLWRLSVDGGQTWLPSHNGAAQAGADHWTTACCAAWQTDAVPLNGSHDMVLEFTEGGGGAYLTVNWAEVPVGITSIAGPHSAELTFSNGTNWDLKISSTPLANPAVDNGDILNTNTSNNPYTLTDLSPSTPYYVYALPTDCGTAWGSHNFTTPVLCAQPSAVSASNVGTVTADIAWNAPLNAGSFNIEWGLAGSFTPGAGTAPNNDVAYTSSYSITDGLQAATQYTVAIQSECGGAEGSSLWTSYNFTTERCEPQEQCTYTLTLGLNSGGLASDWNGTKIDIKQNGILAYTTGALGSTANGTVFSFTLCKGLSTEITVPQSGTYYSTFTNWQLKSPSGLIVASKASGTTINGTPVFSIGNDCEPCYAPVITSSAATETSFNLGFSLGTSWNIKVSTLPLANPATDIADIDNVVETTDNPYTVQGLTAATTYYVYVQNSCGSSWAVAEVSTYTDCSQPTALLLNSVDNNSANISWTAPTGVTDFIIEYGPANTFIPGTGTEENTFTVSTTNANLSDLLESTAYKFAVRSNCGGSVSLWSILNFGTTAEETFGSGIWHGYVYSSPNPDVPANRFNEYKGFVTEQAVFTRNVSSNAWTGQNPVWVGQAPSDFFAVRYKMTYDFPCGNYTFTVPSVDDAARLSLDGGQTWISDLCLNASNCGDVLWNTTSYKNGTYTSSSHFMNGPTDLVLEFFENGGGASVGFNFTMSLLNITVSGITGYSADITIAGGNASSAYEYVLGQNGSVTDPNMETPVQQIGNTFQLSDLTPLTNYQLWIRTECGDGNSAWTPATFTTLASCIPVPGMSISIVTATTANVNWTPLPNASGYTIVWGPQGFVPGTGTPIGTETVIAPPYQITGLSASTNYVIGVQADCGGGDMSTWAQISLLTGCGAMALGTMPLSLAEANNAQVPWKENFEYNEAYQSSHNWSANNQSLPDCWTRVSQVNSGGCAPYIHGGNQRLDFCGFTSGWSAAVMPQLPVEINPAQIRMQFWWNNNGHSGNLKIYLTDNPSSTNLSDYELVGATTTHNADNSISFANYTGSASMYIAFVCDIGGGLVDNLRVWIDNTSLTCAAPTGVTVSDVIDNSATVSWTAGGSETEWAVRYRQQGVSVWTDVAPNPTTNSCNLTGLSAATTYDVQVRAICDPGVDESAWTQTVNFSTPCAPITTPHTESFSNGATGWFPDCWYGFKDGVYRTGTNTDFMAGSSTGAPGQGRGFRLYASYSEGILVSPTLDVDANNLTVSYWSQRESSMACSMSVGYLTDPADASTFVAVQTFTSIDDYPAGDAYQWAEFNVNLSSIPAGIKHVAWKHAINGGVQGTASWYWLDEIGFDYTTSSNCDAPTALTVTPATTGASVSWTAPAAAPISYTLEYKQTSASTYTSLTNITGTTQTLNGLLCGTSYNVRVKSICGSDGTSAYVTATFTTLACPVCNAPTAVSHSAVTPTGATITWTPGGNETEWQVAWKTTAASTWNRAAAGLATYTLTGLTAETCYEVRVKAVCGQSDSSVWSATDNFCTPQIACNAPTNLTAPTVAEHSITVAWTPVNGETNWKVSWKNLNTGISGSGDAHNNDYTGYPLTDLIDSTLYQICVKAICAPGVESDSTCINITTDWVGIHNITLANSLQLYPNPTTGELRITNYELHEGDKIEVYNILGQTQPFSILNPQQITIDVSHLSAGIYTVKIGGYVGKFVKR